MAVSTPRIAMIIAVLVGSSAHPLAATAEGLRERIVRNHFEYVPQGAGPHPTLIVVPGCSGVAFSAPDQEAAVAHRGGPARIIAPAGSGKTRVLTERARHGVVEDPASGCTCSPRWQRTERSIRSGHCMR